MRSQSMPPAYPRPPVQRPRRRQPLDPALIWGWLGITLGLMLITGAFAFQLGRASVNQNNQASQQASIPAAPTPQIHYPPKTEADLHGLAAKGDASAIHEFHSESVGSTGVCPQPKREVTVSKSITGQQLAEDLLAYFYSNRLDSPCGSLVLAYHAQSEAGNAYTAGSIAVDTQNNDPNATNAQRTMTLDIGDARSGQEYTITY